MVNYYLKLGFLFVFITLIGCNKTNENQTDKEDCYSWTLQNKVLEQQIMEYFNTVERGPDERKILHLRIIRKSTSVEYKLTYVTDITSLYFKNINMFLNLNGVKVFVLFDNNASYLYDFKLDDESIRKIMKKYFPDDYVYYQGVKRMVAKDTIWQKSFQEKDAYPPPVTAGDERWTLIFKDGVLVRKKVEY